MTRSSPLVSKLGGVYHKYSVDLAGKSYSNYVDTLREAREIAIDGITRLGVRAAYITKISTTTRKGWTGTRTPNYDQFEKYTIENGKIVVKKRW
jgi:hypothetical protein